MWVTETLAVMSGPLHQCRFLIRLGLSAAGSWNHFLADLGSLGGVRAWQDFSTPLEGTLKKVGILDADFKGTEIPRGTAHSVQCRERTGELIEIDADIKGRVGKAKEQTPKR